MYLGFGSKCKRGRGKGWLGSVKVIEMLKGKIQGKAAANLNYSRLFDTLGSSQKILAYCLGPASKFHP